MKRLIHNFAVVLFAALLGGTVTANAAAPAPLTSLRAVHALSNEEAALGPTVAFEASVTYYRKGNVDMFVQDKGEAIY